MDEEACGRAVLKLLANIPSLSESLNGKGKIFRQGFTSVDASVLRTFVNNREHNESDIPLTAEHLQSGGDVLWVPFLSNKELDEMACNDADLRAFLLSALQRDASAASSLISAPVHAGGVALIPAALSSSLLVDSGRHVAASAAPPAAALHHAAVILNAPSNLASAIR
jgi:hypothetical protein